MPVSMLHNQLQDALLSVTQALPAAAANVTTSGVNVGLGRKTWKEEIHVNVPATPNLVNLALITFQPMHSTDNATWVAIPSLAAQSVAGATANPGGLATDLYWPLPRDANQYIALNCAILTGAGNNTAVSFVFQILPL